MRRTADRCAHNHLSCVLCRKTAAIHEFTQNSVPQKETANDAIDGRIQRRFGNCARRRVPEQEAFDSRIQTSGLRGKWRRGSSSRLDSASSAEQFTMREDRFRTQDRSSAVSSAAVCRLDPSTPLLRRELEGGWNWSGGGNWSGGNRELPKVERGGIGSVRSGRFSTLDRGKKMTLQPPVTQTAVSEINASHEIESRWHAARHPENAKNQKNPENDTGVHL